MTKIIIVLTICFNALAGLGAPLTAVRQVKHATFEIRGTIPQSVNDFTLRFDGTDGMPVATVSTACTRNQKSEPHQLCVTLNSGKREAHHHCHWNSNDFIFRKRGDFFEIIAGNERILRTIVFSSFKGTLYATANADGKPCLENLTYQRLEPIHFGDDFMRTEEEATQWGLWKPQCGDWKIYSVMERIQANPSARIRPGYIPVPDRSPNPFTLSGKSSEDSKDAFIITGYPFWNDYHVAVTVKPSHSSCGIVFSYVNTKNFWYIRWTTPSAGNAPCPLQLIQRVNGKDILQQETRVNARSGNWWRMAVQQNGSDLIVSIDGNELIRHSSNQCVGGLVGLFASGEQETHFDDFEVSSPRTLPVDSLPILAALTSNPQKTSEKENELLNYGIANCVKTESGLANCLIIAPQNSNSLLKFGDSSWMPQRVELTIVPKDGQSFSHAGLAFGENLQYRATVSLTDGTLLISLTDTAQKTVLQQLSLPYSKKEIHFAVDTSNKKVTEVWLNSLLALRMEMPQTEFGGPVALFNSAADVEFSGLKFFAENNRDWEQPVDIQRFANDPFMQGWASSRYAWLRTKDIGVYPQIFNYTGDIYGAFRLQTPVIDHLDYTFGNDNLEDQKVYRLETRVNDANSTATVTLTKARKALFTATLPNLKYRILPGSQVIDEKIGALPRTPDTPSWGTVTFHRDGYVFWLEHDGKTVATVMDSSPLRGRALNASVPFSIDFIHIDLQREHIKDYLFEKAEADWFGMGKWEVTNRFACDPRWSHMNGESFGTAALFTKYDLKDDYTIECFAGMRMRQGELKEKAHLSYPRVGDINIALQTSPLALFDGYNLIIQSWDDVWSEKDTLFMKKEKVIAKTDKEFIPRGRFRSPTARVIPVDWDPGGRPVHGAWYALKIRKSANRYQAWFDNQPIFDVVDDNPLRAVGRIALWTQHNSIVLARVKINYTDIVFPDNRLSCDVAEPIRTIDPPSQTTADDILLDSLAPLNGDQSPEIKCIPLTNGRHAILLTNVNPGGDFAVNVPLTTNNGILKDKIIEFDFASSGDVRWNMYIDPQDAKVSRCFVQLTGPENNAPNLQCIGKATMTQLDGLEVQGRPWHHVKIPLARLYRLSHPWDTPMNADAVLLGFLHEGYLNAGLGGNHTGAWVMLANFAIRTAPESSPNGKPKLVTPTENGEWDMGPIVIGFPNTSDMPPILADAFFFAGNQRLNLSNLNASFSNGRLTIQPLFNAIPPGPLTFRLITSEFSESWSVNANHSLDKTPPEMPVINEAMTVLTGLHDLEGVIQSSSSTDVFQQIIMRDNGLPAVKITSRVCGAANKVSFVHKNLKYIANSPFLFFDIKIPPETYVDFNAHINGKQHTYFGMTDCEQGGKDDAYLGNLSEIKADDTWQRVCIPLYDKTSSIPLSFNYLPAKIKNFGIGNFHYSGTRPGATYQVSNLRVAQAVRLPLKVSWKAKDASGITRAAFKWSPEPNDTPDVTNANFTESKEFTTLQEGLQFFHLKVCDSNGNWSGTIHQPFFIETGTPEITATLPAPQQKAASDIFTFKLSDNARGIVLDKSALTINDKAMRFNVYNIQYDEASHTLKWAINGSSSVFGQRLADGQPMSLSLKGLQTALGLTLPPVECSWTMDFSQDNTTPLIESIILNNRNLNSCVQIYPKRTSSPFASSAQQPPHRTFVIDELTGSNCLDAIAPQRSNFLISLNRVQSIDLSDYRLLRFRCRIFPETKVNLFFTVNNTIYTVKLNGDDEHTVIGTVPDITDDGQWRWITVDLAKDVLDKIDISEKKNITRIHLGTYNRRVKGHVRVDDVAIVPVCPPAPSLILASTDATGIDRYFGEFTQNPSISEELPALPDGMSLSRKYLTVLDKPGLWFLSTSCKDGAGNLSETVQYPFFCDSPAYPVDGDDTLDNHSKHTWRLTASPKKKGKGLPAVLHLLDSPSGNCKVLGIVFASQKSVPMYLFTDVDATAACEGLVADVHLNASPALAIHAVALGKKQEILALSAPATIPSSASWQRGINLKFRESPKEKPVAIGFFIPSFEEKSKATLLFDNIKLLEGGLNEKK